MIDKMFSGNAVLMNTTNPLHYGNNTKIKSASDDITGSFSDALTNAIGKVNNLQVKSDNMVQQMATRPESIDIHSVMIAGQKAELALTFTKAIRDEAIRAYRDLINLR